MDKRKTIIVAIVVAVLLACVFGTVLLTAGSEKEQGAPGTTNNMETESSNVSTEPTSSSQPDSPSYPPELEENLNRRSKVELFVTREDGSVAQGAAVIATNSHGRQEYGTTNEEGVAELYLLEGKQSLRLIQDGQHQTVELTVGGEPIQKQVQLKDERVLYILMGVSGGYEGQPGELMDFSILEEMLKSKYPDAVYITSEERNHIDFRDGDALLTVEIFVENYTARNQYFASELWAEFYAYQESITVWDLDEAGKEVDIEYVDGNVCSVQVRNEYDYEYRNSVSYITGSEYVVQKDYHLSQYSPWADSWGYGYTLERVAGTSSEHRVKALGSGMKTDTFLSSGNASRFRDYATYVEGILPYVDLWMSKEWNKYIEVLASLK